MAVTAGMFLFEVVIEKVNSLVESRHLVIRSEFADVFSLELKDPKQMHIVIPDPPPLPPDPPGKKKPKPKPKPKGKKGAIELPPPEPAIQSGQSVLFSSSAEFLIQNMNKCPLLVSLWAKEDNLSYIGSNSIPWDPLFLIYLQKISECELPTPVTLKEDYNIFEENGAKMMAKIGMQVKLTFMTDRITTAFRTLSEDPSIKKFLYTGMNSKTTSYMCTLKTTEDVFIENSNKIENEFIVDKPKPKIAYADYKNAPGANLTFFNEGDYCCMSQADKPPESIYKSPETCPDIDYIIDYVRKIIVSCNDNMRMLTPRPTIRPRIKATDIDRLCYCKETAWPKGQLAERFKKEAQSGPCPLCIDAGKKPKGPLGTTFDIANIRGPCGKPECKIARDMRAYIQNLVEEDQIEFDINDLIGPCGSKDCTLVEKMQEFLRHEGAFTKGDVEFGLSTRCTCLEKMQTELTKRESCASICSKDCEETGSDASQCEGPACPHRKPNIQKVYNVYYFTVEHDFDKKNTSEPSESDKNARYKYCASTCPSVRASETVSCSKTMCSTLTDKPNDLDDDSDSKCMPPECPPKRPFPPSPADSSIVINLDEIRNPCCIKSCDIAEKVKDFLEESANKNKRRLKCKELEDGDPCYCDCVCTFKFSSKTTYCSVCGGYECLGDDTRDLPDYAKPHPCPVYHKLYDKTRIKTKSPWPDEPKVEAKKESASGKTSKAGSRAAEKLSSSTKPSKTGFEKEAKVKEAGQEKAKKPAAEEKKKVGKFTANVAEEPAQALVEKKPEPKYPYPPVPKHMGWNWTAEDIPGMKPRPQWRPGAANKILVRRYRAIREGVDTIAKKKRAMMQRKKKSDIRPALTVTKQDGEITVTMEVFKKYSKERLLYQYPYDEKPPLTYIIGKTEEEKMKIQKQRERKEHRETRRKRKYLQSTFRDKCQEICLKAYNQAIGILPLPNPNDPECPCHTKDDAISPPIDSCSCSDEGSVSSSDTDNDEWTIEFTPPAAKWDAKAKHPPVMVDNETHYTYLDYKVKLFDKSGNPVPRFFKSHEGKTECSDLGGFWGPGKVWLEINKDGYIGPDERWVPMNFMGPDGMFYSAEEGFFTDTSGQCLKIGIDGYIDKDLKWVWYGKKKSAKSPKSKSSATATPAPRGAKSPAGDAPLGGKEKGDAKSKAAAPPPAPDKNKKGGGKKVALAAPASSGKKSGNPLVMSVSVNYDRSKLPHSTSDYKTYVDPKKIAKYQQIMGDLQEYEDIAEIPDKIPLKTNRASNTPRKQNFYPDNV